MPTLFKGILADWLKQDPGVSAITTDIYPVRKKQNTGWPNIEFTLTAGHRPHSQQGNAGLRWETYQIDCWSKASKEEADTLREAVITALDSFKGLQSGLFVQSALVGEFRDNDEESIDGSDQPAWGSSVDVTFWYEES